MQYAGKRKDLPMGEQLVHAKLLDGKNGLRQMHFKIFSN
jgi:hypothetical protein